MAKRKRQASGGKAPGPPPDILKLEGEWREAVRRSLQKKKPADGWPKPGVLQLAWRWGFWVETIIFLAYAYGSVRLLGK